MIGPTRVLGAQSLVARKAKRGLDVENIPSFFCASFCKGWGARVPTTPRADGEGVSKFKGFQFWSLSTQRACSPTLITAGAVYRHYRYSLTRKQR